MINFKTVIRIIGILLLLETVMLLLCSGVSFYYQDEALVDFWVSAGITAGAGLLLAAMGKGGDRQLTRRDGYVLVSFAWVAFSLFGMLPFYISISTELFLRIPFKIRHLTDRHQISKRQHRACDQYCNI